MRTLEIRGEIEAELTWRRTELRHVRNRLMFPAPDQDALDRAMRTLIVLQYAHIEGFAKQALSIYASAINAERLRGGDANSQVVTSGLMNEIAGLGQPPAGEAATSEGAKLKRAKREVAFVERLVSLASAEVVLPVDEVVSVDMNLSADVLKRCLFRLGIEPSKVADQKYGSLEFIRRTRNAVAHGARTRPIPQGEFEAHVAQTNALMEELVRLIHQACKWGWFRNPSPT